MTHIRSRIVRYLVQVHIEAAYTEVEVAYCCKDSGHSLGFVALLVGIAETQVESIHGWKHLYGYTMTYLVLSVLFSIARNRDVWR